MYRSETPAVKHQNWRSRGGMNLSGLSDELYQYLWLNKNPFFEDGRKELVIAGRHNDAKKFYMHDIPLVL